MSETYSKNCTTLNFGCRRQSSSGLLVKNIKCTTLILNVRGALDRVVPLELTVNTVPKFTLKRAVEGCNSTKIAFIA